MKRCRLLCVVFSARCSVASFDYAEAGNEHPPVALRAVDSRVHRKIQSPRSWRPSVRSWPCCCFQPPAFSEKRRGRRFYVGKEFVDRACLGESVPTLGLASTVTARAPTGAAHVILQRTGTWDVRKLGHGAQACVPGFFAAVLRSTRAVQRRPPAQVALAPPTLPQLPLL